jgi:hypothetical protein
MASNYWAKLWIEMLDDPKVARLDDHLWRRWVEMILLGKECDNCGFLPSVSDMAWRLRTTDAEICADLEALAECGLLSLENGAWHVINFMKRQEAMTDADRQRRHREQQRREQYYGQTTEPSQPSHDAVTDCNVDTETDTEKETEQTPAEKAFFSIWGPFQTEGDRNDILSVEEQIGSDAACEIIQWARRKHISDNLIQAIVSAAGKWDVKPPSNGPPPKEPVVLPANWDAQPEWIRT